MSAYKKTIVLKDCFVMLSYNMLADGYVYSVWIRDGFKDRYGGSFRTYKKLFEYIKTMRKEHEQ